MKRSEINKYIDQAIEIFMQGNYSLPVWATDLPEVWHTRGSQYSEIAACGLGWDITDFGKGRFEEEGLTLFTLRNGNPASGSEGKTYCEKLMLAYPNQVTPTHFHWNKMEDIINRSGGVLAIQLWAADKAEGLSKDSFTVKIDSVEREVKSGEIVRLLPGESICLTPYLYHKFWAEGAPCIIGEVSKVNDDANDNRFYESLGRFPKIEEDAPAKYLLCNEYRIGEKFN